MSRFMPACGGGARGAATLVTTLALAALAVTAPASATTTQSRAAGFKYAVPVQPTSPWPTMRRDLRNTASSPIAARYHGDWPWVFRTGKGIFSTPIVAGDGTVYFGSADTWFYAVSRAGKLEWRFKTGNLIDSAGFVGAWQPRLRTFPVVVPSGDTYLYELRSDRRALTRARRIIWRYRPPPAPHPPGQVPLVNWWEGNAEPGPDGTIYAGSTGDAAYALHPNGTLKWVFRSFGPFWTDPAIGTDGTTYWGSLDLQVHAISKSGGGLWRYPTAGFVTSSPALDNRGTIYVGSFDSDLYAINAATGIPLWKFPTGDHIYASPALDEDAGGDLRAIYFASTDGKVYALAANGHLLWSYDTGDVVRSSPVIGLGPDGVHRIVYVGAGNGTVYAIDAATGRRRWSFDTTRFGNPVLRDRNDLNASPALSRTGIVIGGEDGYLKYVPYDYCLHRRDPRCDTGPGQAFPPNMVRLFPVTPGGNTQLRGGTQHIAAGAVLPLRLVVTRRGSTLDASIQPGAGGPAGLVQINPPVPFTAELSGDGHYLFVVPRGLLTPRRTYSVRAHGVYTANGVSVGNIHLGGTQTGSFDGTLRYRAAAPRGPVPLDVSAGRVSAFELTRLSFPLPAFATSVNQIGFDAYDLIVGALARSRPDATGSGTVLLWAIGARPGPGGVELADPGTPLGFPLAGRYHDDALDLSASNVTLTFSFGPVPVQRFVVRAQLRRNLVAMPGASIYGEVQCLSVPTYGPLLPTQRLCNSEGKLISSGTFITRPYSASGPANRQPAGVSVAAFTLSRSSPSSAGRAFVRLRLSRGMRYPAAEHVLSIVLVDAASGVPVGLDYRAGTAEGRDRHRNLVSVTLTIPAGTALPARVRAYAVSDVFPLAVKSF